VKLAADLINRRQPGRRIGGIQAGGQVYQLAALSEPRRRALML